MASNISGMLNSRLRFSGMVSGLDTESMIKQLMKIERTKVDKVKQQRQLLEWKQDDYRSITSLLKGFDSEFFDVLNTKTYFRSSSAFSTYKSTAKVGGVDSSKVTVNATGSAKPGTHTLEDVKLAQKSIWQTSTGASVSETMTGTVNYSELKQGKSFEINLDGTKKTITLPRSYTADAATNAANLQSDLTSLINTAFGAGNINVTVTGTQLTFKAEGHNLQVNSTPHTYVGNLGFANNQSNTAVSGIIGFPASGTLDISGNFKIKIDGVESTININDQHFANIGEMAGYLDSALSAKGMKVTTDPEGKRLVFVADPASEVTFLPGDSNNVLGSLGIASNTTIKKMQGNNVDFNVSDIGKEFDLFINGTKVTVDITQDFTSATGIDDLVTAINGALSAKGITDVTAVKSGNTLKFEMTGGPKEIRIANSTNTIVTQMGFKSGDTNTLNMYKSLKDLNSEGAIAITDVTDALGNTFKGVQFKINDKVFTFSENETLSNVISKVNSGGAGVTLGYSSVNDKVTLQANTEGAANDVTIEDLAGTNLLTGVFKLTKLQDGKDAQFKMDGVATTRSTNQFTVDGVEYKLLSETAAGEKIDISVSANPDEMVEKIKNFVTKYNELLDKINTKVTEKRPRSGGENKGDYYMPLTDEQKEAMKEDDIKKWEEKAKKGLLKGDSILQDIASKMRKAMYDQVAGVEGGLYSIGIKTGTWEQSGKLVIDEAKLKDALINSPEKVMNIFVKESNIKYSPDLNSSQRSTRYKETGIVNRLYDIVQDSIRTNRDSSGKKGVLLEKAGIEGDITEFKNLLADQLEDQDKLIYKLNQKLIDKEDYYYKKFAAMETALSRMNSQSSWLTQQLGGGQ